MVWFKPSTWFNRENVNVNESIKAFKTKSDELTNKQMSNRSGEGVERFDITGFGNASVGSFNTFYSSYINKVYNNEISRVSNYRDMATNPEISDIIEDAINESLQKNDDDEVITIQIEDDTINNKESLIKRIKEEFYDLFYNKLNIEDNIWDLFYTYYVDGRVYFENIINQSNHKQGIIGVKKLPSETMDVMYDKYGRVEAYLQYLKKNIKRPNSIEEAEKDKNIIVFFPAQMNFIPYQYGQTKNVVYGYLEKCKIPYNQLKLLETSMIIYRIVRAPERFVFKIDTGNMPKDKAMKFVEKVKQKMNKKESFDPNTGTLVGNTDILSIQDNFYLPQGENRGSDISTVGGSNIGFKELDDIHYFSKKLYRSLKYPLSRIEKRFEERSSDILFGGNSTGEITRDEIKWSKFLERQQKKFGDVFRDIFLLHLKFKGLKEQYGLDKDNVSVMFNPPSDYRDQMQQNLRETKFSNYTQLSNESEFSKYYLMKRYLGWTEEQIKENADGKKKDKELGLVQEEEGGMRF